MVITDMHAKGQGQKVQKLHWNRNRRRTDGGRRLHYITSRANAVDRHNKMIIYEIYTCVSEGVCVCV